MVAAPRCQLWSRLKSLYSFHDNGLFITHTDTRQSLYKDRWCVFLFNLINTFSTPSAHYLFTSCLSLIIHPEPFSRFPVLHIYFSNRKTRTLQMFYIFLLMFIDCTCEYFQDVIRFSHSGEAYKYSLICRSVNVRVLGLEIQDLWLCCQGRVALKWDTVLLPCMAISRLIQLSHP